MESFFLNLALGAFVLSLLLALFSFVVYFFRLAFLSIAVSHAVLAGLAIGVFLGVEPTISALVFSLLVGWLIAFLRRKTGLTEDASIGIVLALAMAVGIILIYLSGYQGNLLAYLFGSITTISPTDVAILILFLLAGGLFFKFNFEKILYLCFDEESAYASGINTDFLYYTLVGMLSFIVTFATKLAGVILTHALLILPTAVAYQLVWHYGELLLLSGGVALTSTFGGLILAYYTDMPAGPSIILVGGILFIGASLWRVLKGKAFKSNR